MERMVLLGGFGERKTFCSCGGFPGRRRALAGSLVTA
jgi:hypothetical protein